MLKYWYFLLPAILMALIPSETIDKTTKKWIPDDRKRAKFFMGILIAMATFFTILLLLVTKNIPLGFRIPMSVFPLVGVGLSLLIAKFINKKK